MLISLCIQLTAQEEPAIPDKIDRLIPIPPPPFMDEKSEQQYLSQLSTSLKAELEQIKEINKNRYAELLMDAYWNSHKSYYRGMTEFEQQIIEMEQKKTEYEIRSEVLALKYNKANEGQKAEIKKQLKNVLNELFAIKEATKKNEIEILQKELAKLKKSIAVRSKNKDEIVRRRMHELLNEDAYLDWE